MGKLTDPIDLGVVEVYWLAILQPKGFLKVLEFFIAILTFSLTAGFTAVAIQHCTISNNGSIINDTFTNHVFSPYPFDQFQFRAHNGSTSTAPYPIGNGPQFFVCWGVFTMFYSIVAILVYMSLSKKFVISGLTSLPDWLVVVDFLMTCVWVFMYVLAFLIWAIQSNVLKASIVDYLDNQKYCANKAYPLSFAQTDISLTFAFLLMFVLVCNVYFVLKDTSYYMRWKENRQKSYNPPSAAGEEVY